LQERILVGMRHRLDGRAQLRESVESCLTAFVRKPLFQLFLGDIRRLPE